MFRNSSLRDELNMAGQGEYVLRMATRPGYPDAWIKLPIFRGGYSGK
jgi:hypothetical protein